MTETADIRAELAQPRAPLEVADLLALILSLLGFSPIAALCGYISHRQAQKAGLRQHVIGVVGLILGVLGTVIWICVLAAISSGDATSNAGPDYSAVQSAYSATGYALPDYTDVASQSKGVCQNLASGQTLDEAAQSFAQGWSSTLPQAQAIVTAINDSVCHSS